MLVNVADLRQYLDLGDEPGQDALLARFIEEAQKIVETETGKVFEAQFDTTHAFHAVNDVGGKTLYLRASLWSLTAVVNGNGQTIPIGELALEPNEPPYRRLRIRDFSTANWTYAYDPGNAISVTGKWADYPYAPADIRTATRSIAAWLFKRRDQGPDFDNASVSNTAGVVLIPPSLPRDVQVILDRYTDKPGAGSRVVRGKLVL